MLTGSHRSTQPLSPLPVHDPHEGFHCIRRRVALLAHISLLPVMGWRKKERFVSYDMCYFPFARLLISEFVYQLRAAAANSMWDLYQDLLHRKPATENQNGNQSLVWLSLYQKQLSSLQEERSSGENLLHVRLHVLFLLGAIFRSKHCGQLLRTLFEVNSP